MDGFITEITKVLWYGAEMVGREGGEVDGVLTIYVLLVFGPQLYRRIHNSIAKNKGLVVARANADNASC